MKWIHSSVRMVEGSRIRGLQSSCMSIYEPSSALDSHPRRRARACPSTATPMVFTPAFCRYVLLLGIGLCLLNMESSPNLQAAPGDLIWSFQTGGEVSCCPAIGADGTVYVDPLDNWTFRYSETGLSGNPAITYGNNQFVAVGGRPGTILTSPDGIDWTRRASGTTDWLYNITYGNNQFVAVGRQILTSPDGINWTCRASGYDNGMGDPYSIYGIAYGNNAFVAVGSAVHFFNPFFGQTYIILTSPDGINWTGDYWGASILGLYAIAFGNSMFVAGSVFISTSPDGIDWTRRASGTTDGLMNITYGNNQFVVVGRNGVVLSSPDGITWTQRNSGTTNFLRAVAYGNNEFVAMGGNGVVLSSPDGITWTSRSSGTQINFWSVAYGNNTFVAIDAYGTIMQSAPLKSIASPVLSAHFSNSGLELTIAGTIGQSYSLESADEFLGSTPWLGRVSLTLTNSTGVWCDATATNLSRRFYRAVTLP
jgi:hypothetical protein